MLSALEPIRAQYRAVRRAVTKKRRLRERFEANLRPTDVFLVGHPKSGNTWLAYMLAILIRPHGGCEVTLANIGSFVPVIHNRDHEISHHAELGSPRVFRNEQPVYPERYPLVIYLVRDPRAVLVSYWHMYGVVCGRCDRPLDDFVREYLRSGCIREYEPGLQRWDRQVERWTGEARRNARVEVVRYEDMVEDRGAVLSRLSQFIGLEADDYRLETAVHRGDFERMRRDEEQHGAESYPGELGRRGRFIRKGRVDSWRDEMEERTADRVTRECSTVMQSLGYVA